MATEQRPELWGQVTVSDHPLAGEARRERLRQLRRNLDAMARRLQANGVFVSPEQAAELHGGGPDPE